MTFLQACGCLGLHAQPKIVNGHRALVPIRKKKKTLERGTNQWREYAAGAGYNRRRQLAVGSSQGERESGAGRSSHQEIYQQGRKGVIAPHLLETAPLIHQTHKLHFSF